jgi:hypothetical protein
MKQCHPVEYYGQETPPMVGFVHEFDKPLDMLTVYGGEMVCLCCQRPSPDKYHTKKCGHRIG